MLTTSLSFTRRSIASPGSIAPILGRAAVFGYVARQPASIPLTRSLHTSRPTRSTLTPEDEAKIKAFTRSILKGEQGTDLRDLLRSDEVSWRAKEKAIKDRLKDFDELSQKVAEDKVAEEESTSAISSAPKEQEQEGEPTERSSEEDKEGKTQTAEEKKAEQERNERIAQEPLSPFGGPAGPQPVAWQQFLMFLLAGLLFVSIPAPQAAQQELSWNDCVSLLRAGRIAALTVVNGEFVRITDKSDGPHQAGARPFQPEKILKIRSPDAFQADVENAMAELDIPFDQRPAVEMVDEEQKPGEGPGLLFYVLPLALSIPLLLL